VSSRDSGGFRDLPRNTTSFAAEILGLIRQVPSGSVVTYGQLASLVGRRGASRQVGFVLASLPEDSSVPWHRVVNARGEVSRRSDGSGIAEGYQRHLLGEEGVEFDSQGRIDLDRFSWEPPRAREEVRRLVEPGNR
jgi:methylated-DNA-protein-cysteine methyltransferase-like protein